MAELEYLQNQVEYLSLAETSNTPFYVFITVNVPKLVFE